MRHSETYDAQRRAVVEERPRVPFVHACCRVFAQFVGCILSAFMLAAPSHSAANRRSTSERKSASHTLSPLPSAPTLSMPSFQSACPSAAAALAVAHRADGAHAVQKSFALARLSNRSYKSCRPSGMGLLTRYGTCSSNTVIACQRSYSQAMYGRNSLSSLMRVRHAGLARAKRSTSPSKTAGRRT